MFSYSTVFRLGLCNIHHQTVAMNLGALNLSLNLVSPTTSKSWVFCPISLLCPLMDNGHGVYKLPS